MFPLENLACKGLIRIHTFQGGQDSFPLGNICNRSADWLSRVGIGQQNKPRYASSVNLPLPSQVVDIRDEICVLRYYLIFIIIRITIVYL